LNLRAEVPLHANPCLYEISRGVNRLFFRSHGVIPAPLAWSSSFHGAVVWPLMGALTVTVSAIESSEIKWDDEEALQERPETLLD